MIDFLTLMIATARTKVVFSNAVPGIDPNKATEIQSSFTNSDMLTLGAFYLHLFEHAGASDVEIAYLEDASVLWAGMSDFYQRVGKLRATAEQLSLTPPSPQKYDILKSVLDDSKNIEGIAKTILDKAQKLLDKLKSTDYLETHPINLGVQMSNWSWHELLIARRTGAFVSNLNQAAINQAPNNDEARAFVHGAFIGYVTHAVGTIYINDVVGGARRSHPYRQKLARNTIGAWYQANFPSETSSLDKLRDIVIRVKDAPAKVALIKKLIAEALATTYPQLANKPVPDIEAAISSMAHHLELLTSFLPLALPSLTPTTIQVEIEKSGARGETDNFLLSLWKE